jgi:hypothetical protein
MKVSVDHPQLDEVVLLSILPRVPPLPDDVKSSSPEETLEASSSPDAQNLDPRDGSTP